jgi:hypothetical protein
MMELNKTMYFRGSDQHLEYDDGRTAEMEKFYIEVVRFKTMR